MNYASTLVEAAHSEGLPNNGQELRSCPHPPNRNRCAVSALKANFFALLPRTMLPDSVRANGRKHNMLSVEHCIQVTSVKHWLA